MMRARRGFTLLEMAIVMAVMAISAALVVPAWSDLGSTPPAFPGSALVTLLRDARRLAIDNMQSVSVRIDPATLYYRVDTTGANGTGDYFEGTLEMTSSETLESELPRLRYFFRPTGAAIGDTVVVRGEMTVVLSVDTWSGQALVYAR